MQTSKLTGEIFSKDHNARKNLLVRFFVNYALSGHFAAFLMIELHFAHWDWANVYNHVPGAWISV